MTPRGTSNIQPDQIGDAMLPSATRSGKDRGPTNMRAMRIRRAALALLLAIPASGCGMGGVLASCGPPRPRGLTAGDLVGRYAGSHAGTITLNENGTFEADQLEQSDYTLPGPLPSTPFTAGNQAARTTYQSGRGTWRLMDRAAIQTDLSLIFERADGSKSSWDLIEVGGTRADPLLWYFYDDPDNCDVRTLARSR